MYERDLPGIVEYGLIRNKDRLIGFLEKVPVRYSKEESVPEDDAEEGYHFVDERFTAQMMVYMFGPVSVAVRRRTWTDFSDGLPEDKVDFVVGDYTRLSDRSLKARKLFNKLQEAEIEKELTGEKSFLAEIKEKMEGVSGEQITFSKVVNQKGFSETQYLVRLADGSLVRLGQQFLPSVRGVGTVDRYHLQTEGESARRVEEDHPHIAFGVPNDVEGIYSIAQQKHYDFIDPYPTSSIPSCEIF
jgi:hypothetical protein